MPRNGSGVYSKPAGTTAVTLTPVSSSKYNETIDDLVADANTARPIVAGGHGGITAVAGADNLSTKGTDIPSATTTDIGAATGRYVHITGTTTITGLGTKTAGVLRIVTFDGALTLTHNATTLILPSGANILTAAGDVATFISEGGGNWRCVGYSRASGTAVTVAGGYLTKSGNYTTVDADFAKEIRFTAAATLAIDTTANLRTDWRVTIWADSGSVTIDPNSTDTINGSATLVVQQGQKAVIYKTAATTFQANITSDALSGPQLQGYSTGLALTTNATDATNDVDIAVGAAASDVSPYYLMQLTSALVKRIDASWAVGTNQGGLDTGAVGNNTYYIWLIQRSDTGVTDVLFSLSATAPTMPTNYDRKRLIGFLTRASATNGAPTSLLGHIQLGPEVPLSTLSSAEFDIPAGVKRGFIVWSALSTNGTVPPQVQLGTASAFVTTGYVGATTSAADAALASIGLPIVAALSGATVLNGGAEFLAMPGGKWKVSTTGGFSNAAASSNGTAIVQLSAPMTRVRLNLSSTAFDAGTASAIWEI